MNSWFYIVLAVLLSITMLFIGSQLGGSHQPKTLNLVTDDILGIWRMELAGRVDEYRFFENRTFTQKTVRDEILGVAERGEFSGRFIIANGDTVLLSFDNLDMYVEIFRVCAFSSDRIVTIWMNFMATRFDSLDCSFDLVRVK